MEAGFEPGAQAGLGLGTEVDARDPDLGESELTRPPTQALEQGESPRVVLVVMTLLHPPILGTHAIPWPDEAACAASAARLAAAPALRDAFVELEGPLGAGKTTFARHLLHALGVEGRVKSPTYALVETYEYPRAASPPLPAGGEPSGKAGPTRALDGDGKVAHFDFYRFDDPQEWEDAGLRDLFGAPGLKLVEWAVKAAPLLPIPDLRVTITPQDEASRAVRFDAMTPRGLGLLDNLRT